MSERTANASITMPPGIDRVAAFGPAERHLKLVREAFNVGLTARDDRVAVSGDAAGVRAATRVIESLVDASRRGRHIGRDRLFDLIAESAGAANAAADHDPALLHGDAPAHNGVSGRADSDGYLDVYAAGRRIEPRSDNQTAYVRSIMTHDLVFAAGPAGTGKTYLAVASAIHLLKTGRVKKAVLARPAVEAGEKLGYLPGDQFAKVNPYLRPLLDALHDMMDFATVKRFMAADVVEVVPLAFMRGRTLNDAVIILDEAQNATRGQMHMFLTRMGQRSKMIVTGDTTQIDLPQPDESGLVDAMLRLRATPGVGFVALERADVVRHPLVQRVIDAYTGDGQEPRHA